MRGEVLTPSRAGVVCTPGQWRGLNRGAGGASARRVECEYEEDVRLYVNVDDVWDLVAG